jgi:amicoumacin kinase
LIKAIAEQFNDAVLHEAAARYGMTGDQLKKLGGFESYVFEYTRHSQSYILKITHTIRRSETYIMGELEWLNFLADRDVSVARAMPSDHGRLIERFETESDGAWLVIAYEKAPGHRPTAAEWNADLFTTLGRLMGKMHRLTQSYRLSNPAFKRQEWHEEEQLKARKYLPAHEAQVIAVADELLAHIHSLPTPPDAYGMLHTDLHHGNWFIDAGKITAFDFDDCHYNWFVSDIAIMLLSAVWFAPTKPDDPVTYTQHFLEHFFRGYHEENHLDPKWLAYIGDFMRLRDLLQFIVVYQAMDVANFTPEQHAMLDEHRRRVVEWRPFVSLDWMQFAKR